MGKKKKLCEGCGRAYVDLQAHLKQSRKCPHALQPTPSAENQEEPRPPRLGRCSNCNAAVGVEYACAPDGTVLASSSCCQCGNEDYYDQYDLMFMQD